MRHECANRDANRHDPLIGFTFELDEALASRVLSLPSSTSFV